MKKKTKKKRTCKDKLGGLLKNSLIQLTYPNHYPNQAGNFDTFLQVKHFFSFINQFCLLVISQQLGLELVVCVVVVLVLIFLANVAMLTLVKAARFSKYCSDAIFVRAASLSYWKMR